MIICNTVHWASN